MEKENKLEGFIEKLSEMTSKMFGWNSEYYLTELDEKDAEVSQGSRD